MFEKLVEIEEMASKSNENMNENEREKMSKEKENIISKTMDGISQETALLLLQKLALKFRTKPRESMSLLSWIMSLLNKHGIFLSENIESRKLLIYIHQTIDYQTQYLLPAMKLQGRLNLIVKQIYNQKQNYIQNINNNHTNDTIFNEQSNNSDDDDTLQTQRPLFIHNESTLLRFIFHIFKT